MRLTSTQDLYKQERIYMSQGRDGGEAAERSLVAPLTRDDEPRRMVRRTEGGRNCQRGRR